MTALLTRAAQALSVRARSTRHPLIDGCPPDCFYDYRCDSSHRYYRRQCCYHPDCTQYCLEWVDIGTC
jgi:hypothetical protein